MKKFLSVLSIFILIPILTSFTTVTTITNQPSNEEDLIEANVSWYGAKFHGKLTASGEVYDMHEFTAAHKKLKFGTQVLISNPRNGKTVIVKVNDRGPFVKGRTFDLSKAAFDEIADINRGVLKIKYKILED